MNSGQANILLVDDVPENLIALQALLSELGENLVCVSSGEAALKAVLDYDFAVILMDVQMFGMDGFETASLIKEREKSRFTPIIFITAINREEDYVFKGYSLRAVDYIFKPVHPEILKTKVGVFVDLFKKSLKIQQQADQIEAMNQQLEQQLAHVQQLNNEMVTLNHELESFSYSVSHDLRAPLRSIRSFSQALLEDYKDQLHEEGQNYLQRIYAATRRMTELIDSLLQLSHLTRGKLQRQRVDLSSIAEDILLDLQRAQPEREVKFDVGENVFVEGDERLLRRLLENLLHNAWKFTSHHTHARIEFGQIDQPNGKPIFFVTDDGAGFDMEYTDQLFSPFQRLHTDDEFEGHGIGLATVQRIINRHGGRIWAEGKIEEGATFYFTL